MAALRYAGNPLILGVTGRYEVPLRPVLREGGGTPPKGGAPTVTGKDVRCSPDAELGGAMPHLQDSP